MSCWGKWSLLHCNKGTDLRSMALCKGIPTKVIQHMATVTEEPTTKPRISSGCKAFTLPKPVASQTAQKTQTVHKATLTLPELCLRMMKVTGLTVRQADLSWVRKTRLVQFRAQIHREYLYKMWIFITLSTHEGISIANTSAVVFWESWSCCSNLFIYGKKNRNILAQEGGNSIFCCLWKDWILLSKMDAVTLIFQVILNLSNQNSTVFLMLTIKPYFSYNESSQYRHVLVAQSRSVDSAWVTKL